MLRILFICTGNSGRSAIAASFAKDYAPKNAEFLCAGDRKVSVKPLSKNVMEEIGHYIPDCVDCTLDDIKYSQFDVVITLCNQAREICPVFPGAPAQIHWPLSDPKDTAGDYSLDSQLQSFRQLRDDIQRRVESLFNHGFLEAVTQVRITFEALLENLTDGVLAHDLERRIFYFNKAAQRITGFDYSEVVGRDCHEVFPGKICGGDCSFCENGQEHLSRLKYPQFFIRRDGDRRDLEMSVVTINTVADEVIGALVVFRDQTEMVHMRRKLEESRGFHGIIGRHISMQKVFDSIIELAEVNAPILIHGESGTGKEMVALALHELSSRASAPFVPVNCGALPEGTLESELFGHVRGAFTGAIRDKKGRFELAEGGTIFLDEIGEISPAMQVKLLRVIQEKNFVPVGGEKQIEMNARIICATNKDLRMLTKQGLFREDLFYRLAVVPISLPPLRERRSDIPLLVDYFLDRFSSDTGKNIRKITSGAIDILKKYRWPGNVRELRNAIQFGIIKCRSDTLDVSHLPPETFGASDRFAASKPGRHPKLNKQMVEEALEQAGGNKAKAARLLGVSRTTLYRFIDSMRL